MSAALCQRVEAEERAAVIREARAWVGTPYHAHGRLKGIGVDCGNLLCCVYENAGMVGAIDPGHYPTGWHLHRSEELFLDWIRRAGGKPVVNGSVRPGDLAVWKFGRTYSHGGILVDPTGRVVHSFLQAGVIETSLHEEPLASRPVLFFTLWG